MKKLTATMTMQAIKRRNTRAVAFSFGNNEANAINTVQSNKSGGEKRKRRSSRIKMDFAINENDS